MGLMGLRDLAWDNGFPGLGINTTLMCHQLMGIYSKAKLAPNSNKVLLASSSKHCCSMMSITPSMPGDFRVEMRKQPISVYHSL